MGCVTAYGYRVGAPVEASGYAVGQRVVASGYRVGSPVKAYGYAVCPIPTVSYIVFDKDMLSWGAMDVGVTKYNTLTATHSWSLEEIEIEELL